MTPSGNLETETIACPSNTNTQDDVFFGSNVTRAVESQLETSPPIGRLRQKDICVEYSTRAMNQN